MQRTDSEKDGNTNGTQAAAGLAHRRYDPGFTSIHGFVLRAGLLPLAERASELRLSVSTLRRAMNAGELAHVRIGDRVFIGPAHAAEWLKSKELKGGPA